MKEKQFNITGTVHGSIVYAESEGKARNIFHRVYGGESIVHLSVDFIIKGIIKRIVLQKSIQNDEM